MLNDSEVVKDALQITSILSKHLANFVNTVMICFRRFVIKCK